MLKCNSVSFRGPKQIWSHSDFAQNVILVTFRLAIWSQSFGPLAPPLFDNFLTTFLTFFILMVLASCGNKYYGTNFIYAVPSSRLIAPEAVFLSRTSKVKVWAGMNFDFDEHSRARIWARLRIRHGSG
jgi:hypothetical protein